MSIDKLNMTFADYQGPVLDANTMNKITSKIDETVDGVNNCDGGGGTGGGSGNEVVIGDESQITEDTKLFINQEGKIKYKNDDGDWIEVTIPGSETPLIDINGTPSDTNTYNANAINELIDSISEIVENENGTAIKYSNGIMICTRTIEVNDARVSQAWGSLFYYQDYTEYRFAQEFKDIPTGFYMHFAPTGAAGCWLGAYEEQIITKSSFAKFSLFRPTSNTVNGKLFVTAVGKWK